MENLKYKGEVPPHRCSGDSIIPMVATSHQSLKRGETEKDWQPKPVSFKHELMSSASEDVYEPSSPQPSEIRLFALEPKGKRIMGLAIENLTSKHSQETRWIASL